MPAQIVVTLQDDGNINVAPSPGLAPIVITGALELAKALIVNQVVNPKEPPRVVVPTNETTMRKLPPIE